MTVSGDAAKPLKGPGRLSASASSGSDRHLAGRSGQSAAPQARSKRDSVQPPRVLLVDDDTSVREAMRMLLQVEGFAVSVAATLADALDVARGVGPIDVIVADYHLGCGKTGADVITALRAQQDAALAALLMTGDTSLPLDGDGDDVHLRMARKPMRAEELLDALAELLASARTG